jgi:hypothetical protein
VRTFPARRLRRLHQLQHHADFVDLLLEGNDGQDRLLQAVELADVLLGTFGIVPERGLAHLPLHRLDFPLLLIAVKETSTSARRAS